MKQIKCFLIIVIAAFLIVASILIYAGTKEEKESNLPLSDLVSTEPIKFEQLRAVSC